MSSFLVGGDQTFGDDKSEEGMFEAGKSRAEKSRIGAQLATFVPIELAQMDRVALLDRCEVKYLFHIRQLPSFLNELRGSYSDDVVRPEGWSEASHSNDVDPNFEVVFLQDKVNELTITIDPETWEALQANMIEIYGEPNPDRGQGGPGGGFSGGGFPGGEPPEGFEPPASGERPQGGRSGMNRNVTLDKAEVTDQWPLIRYLLDEPLYYEKYIGYMEATINNLFVPEELEAKYTRLAEIIGPYASKDVGEAEFASAIQQLIDYAATRAEAVTSFLNEQ